MGGAQALVLGVVLVLVAVLAYVLYNSRPGGGGAPSGPSGPPVVPSGFSGHSGPPPSLERAAPARYYSFALTVLKGGVLPPLSCAPNACGSPYGLEGQIFAQAGDPALDDGRSPLYQVPYPAWRGKTYVDFDVSSGLMCGNSWGPPSRQAEVFYNILALDAPHPLVGDPEVHRALVGLLFYDGAGGVPGGGAWQYSMGCTYPGCVGGAQLPFGEGLVYVGGLMGTLAGGVGDQIAWGHLGQTYGYVSLSQFFVGGASGFTGILAQANLAVVLATNTDAATGPTGGGQDVLKAALASFLVQARDADTYGPMGDAGAVQQGALAALDWALGKWGAFQGLTVTFGYFFIPGAGQPPVRGSATMTIDGGKPVVPTGQFPFQGPRGVQYLGAAGGREPAYFYGSGTKPITAALVAGALARAWKRSIYRPDADGGVGPAFVRWYVGHGPVTPEGGDAQTLSTYGAATMGQVLRLPAQSYYSEAVENWTGGAAARHVLQDWLGVIYGPGACAWRGRSQRAADCPTNPCVELDSSYSPEQIAACGCARPPAYVGANALAVAFGAELTPVALTCMQGGVPDSDTVTVPVAGMLPAAAGYGTPASSQLDFLDQATLRARSIGPANYLRELVGFNWRPGWTGVATPRTVRSAANTYYPGGPPAQYSSTGFALLGTLLWLFDPNGPKTPGAAKDWTAIDLNAAYLPAALAGGINFAGTAGNGGAAYFVLAGGVPQRGVLPGCNVAAERRTDCLGPAGANAQTCMADPTCCYSPTFSVQAGGGPTPWCYRKGAVRGI